MIIPNDDLRMLCIKNDWFTCGSNRQYEKLFDSNRMGASLHDIVLIIWLCSDDVPMHQIREELEKAQKEYDALMDAAEDAMNEHIANGERASDEIYCGYFD